MPRNMQFFAHTLSSVKCVKIFNEKNTFRLLHFFTCKYLCMEKIRDISDIIKRFINFERSREDVTWTRDA